MVEYLLGVNSGVGKHDGAAALLRDGELVSLVEQERLSRRKQAWGEAAAESIRRCLESASLDFEAVSAVAFGWDERLYSETTGAAFDEGDFLATILPREVLGCSRLPPIHYVPHHLAHAWSALAPSGFERAALLVVDSRGELASSTLAHADGRRIEVLEEFGLHESLGNFYALAAEWAGLSYLGAGKLMGLASYGRPIEPIPLAPTARGYAFSGLGAPDRDPRLRYYHQQREALLSSFAGTFPYAPGDGREPMAYAAFAAAVQNALEAVGLRLAEILRSRTGCPNLCLAGGVALNCGMNGALARSGLWERLFVPPFAGDAGVSAGAAFKVWHDFHPRSPLPPVRLPHAYWGSSYADRELREALEGQQFPFEKLAEGELIARTADLLASHRVVGWFQGRAEAGPRALGSRSILGNPCKRDNLVRINQMKGREIWRPLAPSVTAEEFTRFFDTPASAEPLSEFMLVAANVRPEVRALIPAAVHVDGSARPHRVIQPINPRFWALISAFGQRTGVPVLINTSLNGPGEPIVERPREALEILARGGVDALVLGDYLVERGR